MDDLYGSFGCTVDFFPPHNFRFVFIVTQILCAKINIKCSLTLCVATSRFACTHWQWRSMSDEKMMVGETSFLITNHAQTSDGDNILCAVVNFLSHWPHFASFASLLHFLVLNVILIPTSNACKQWMCERGARKRSGSSEKSLAYKWWEYIRSIPSFVLSLFRSLTLQLTHRECLKKKMHVLSWFRKVSWAGEEEIINRSSSDGSRTMAEKK